MFFYLRPPPDARVPPLLLDGDEEGEELRIEELDGL